MAAPADELKRAALPDNALGERLTTISGAFFERFPHLRPGACRCDWPLSAGPPFHEQECPSAKGLTPVLVVAPAQVEPVQERPIVTLDDRSIARAVRLAEKIAAAKAADGRRDRFAPDRDHREQDTYSFAAEIAVSKHLGLPWRGDLYTRAKMRRAKPADVGENVEVRTWRGRGAFFPIRDGDPADRLVVLALGEIPRFTLFGWSRIGPLKKPEYRHDDQRRHPYFRVPQYELALFPIPAGVAR